MAIYGRGSNRVRRLTGMRAGACLLRMNDRVILYYRLIRGVYGGFHGELPLAAGGWR
jgi:hypothetical protein